jgi:hypothetical protein
MVRLALVIGVLAVGFILVKERLSERGAGTGAVAAPAVDTAQMPRQFRELLAARPDPAQVLLQRGALPGLGAIRKLAGASREADDDAPLRPFADVGSPRELRKVRADIRRDFAALNRLSSIEGGASAEQVQETLTEVYSAPVLEALGPDGRRDFAERYAGRTQVAQKVKVLDFEGVFVSGRRALAQVVYRLSTRAPSGHFVARAPATWTVTLAREGGRWRFLQGLEND